MRPDGAVSSRRRVSPASGARSETVLPYDIDSDSRVVSACAPSSDAGDSSPQSRSLSDAAWLRVTGDDGGIPRLAATQVRKTGSANMTASLGAAEATDGGALTIPPTRSRAATARRVPRVVARSEGRGARDRSNPRKS